MGAFVPPDFYPTVCFIIWKIHRSSHQYPMPLEKKTKPILWEEPRKLVPILLPKCGCFFSIRFLSHGILHHMENTRGFPSISHSIGKHSKMHPVGTAWKLVSKLSQSMGGFLPLDSHPVVSFMAWKMHDFFNQFLLAWENAAKPTPWERTDI